MKRTTVRTSARRTGKTAKLALNREPRFIRCPGQETLHEGFLKLVEARKEANEARYAVGHQRGRLYQEDQQLEVKARKGKARGNQSRPDSKSVTEDRAERRTSFEVSRVAFAFKLSRLISEWEKLRYLVESFTSLDPIVEGNRKTAQMNVTRTVQLLAQVLDEINEDAGETPGHRAYLRELPSYKDALDLALLQSDALLQMALAPVNLPILGRIITGEVKSNGAAIVSTHPGETPRLAQISGHIRELREALNQAIEDERHVWSYIKNGSPERFNNIELPTTADSLCSYELHRASLTEAFAALNEAQSRALAFRPAYRKTVDELNAYLYGSAVKRDPETIAELDLELLAFTHNVAVLDSLIVRAKWRLHLYEAYSAALPTNGQTVETQFGEAVSYLAGVPNQLGTKRAKTD